MPQAKRNKGRTTSGHTRKRELDEPFVSPPKRTIERLERLGVEQRATVAAKVAKPTEPSLVESSTVSSYPRELGEANQARPGPVQVFVESSTTSREMSLISPTAPSEESPSAASSDRVA